MLKKFYFKNKFNEYVSVKKINNFIFIDTNKIKKNFTSMYSIKIFKNFYTYTFIIYFLRIKWRGKAYRIRFFKKNSKFTLNFGHSHWYKILFKKLHINFFRIKQQNYVVIFTNRLLITKLNNFFNNIRKYNKYTKRGIRTKRRIFLRRFGKISQVNSILHSF